jgi:hypothetical protein
MPARWWSPGSLEGCLIRTSHLQRRDKPLDGVAMRMVSAAFELLDAVHAQSCALGQALLGQPCREPMPPQQLVEAFSSDRRVTGFSLVHGLCSASRSAAWLSPVIGCGRN